MSRVDWSRLPKDATHKHIIADMAYRKYEGSWWAYVGANGWCKTMESDLWIQSYCISKEDDVEVIQWVKKVSCIEDLQTGMFVFMQGGNSAYVNIDDCGRIGFLFTNQHTSVNYVMQSSFNGLGYSPNRDIDITHWGYSLAGERYPVAISEAEKKIRELEVTIALAQKQLQEYKEMK